MGGGGSTLPMRECERVSGLAHRLWAGSAVRLGVSAGLEVWIQARGPAQGRDPRPWSDSRAGTLARAVTLGSWCGRRPGMLILSVARILAQVPE